MSTENSTPQTRDVVWLAPRVVVEVSYSEMLSGRLRDPDFFER